ncbi:MAG: TetR/AcrR family transcriptional regulator [Sciscionella sp.]
MAPATEGRRAAIGDAAIGLIAVRGMRGLTHRAVDIAAGLPTGSTSYYARTRAALLELAINRMAELDETGFRADPPLPNVRDPEVLVDGLVGYLHHSMTEGRSRQLARFEFALEASRRPELRDVYDRAGRGVRASAQTVLAAAGSVDAARHARMLIAWCEGVVFDSVAGAGWRHTPSRDELRAGVRELLAGMLGAAARDDY